MHQKFGVTRLCHLSSRIAYGEPPDGEGQLGVRGGTTPPGLRSGAVAPSPKGGAPP